MNQINLWWIRTTTTQKFLKISLKNKRYNWMWRILHADQRQKQNRKEGNLLTIHRVSFRWTLGVGLILNQGIILSLCARGFEESNPSSSSFSTSTTRDDGAVQFWRIKEHLQSQFPQVPHWSDDRWKACLAAGGGAKRRFQYCNNVSWIIVYFRALQEHSGRNLIDPSLQDNVVIQSGFFHHIYHIGCAFNLHSIINNGLILGGQNSSKRQTVFFLPIDPRDKEHKDPEKIDLNVPYHVMHNTCITHGRNIKMRYIGSMLILQFGKEWHSIRLDRMQSSFKEYFHLIVFQKWLDWRLEKSFLKKHTCLLDLLDSHKEKLLGKQNSSNQPNQFQSQFVIDQGILMSRKTW